ncbi:MAG: hypothetical protein J6K78_04955 [Tidjanibacter sp.]|nr:hypothetical protein [Tidjanibacter sp.]
MSTKKLHKKNEKHEAVFDLVKLMSKAEKRNFKLYATRLDGNEDAKFLKLFTALDSLEQYDEARVLSLCPEISKQQLPNLKAHLYKQILTSLRLLNVQHSTTLQIREQIDFVKILFDKGLYTEAQKVLEKVEAKARATEQWSAVLDIVDLQRQLKVLSFSSEMSHVADKTARSSGEVSTMVNNIASLSLLSVQCYALHQNIGFARSQKDLDRLQNFFKPKIDAYEGKAMTFTETFYFYQVKAWYYYISHRTTLSYRYALKWVNHFNTHPEMKEVMYDGYMRGYAHVLDGMYLMHKYKAFVRTLEEFERETKEIATLNDNAAMISQQILFTSQLNKCIMAGTYKEGLWLVKNIDSYLKKYGNRLTIHEKMPLYYKVATLYFGDGNYHKCIEYLSYIISVKDHNIRRDLQCYARMLNLMALYDAGLDFNIDYQIRSVYSFIVKMRDMTEMKAVLLSFFKSFGNINAIDLKKELKILYERLKPYETHPYERRTFYYIDILSWLESKISDKSMGQIVREKFEAEEDEQNKKNKTWFNRVFGI